MDARPCAAACSVRDGLRSSAMESPASSVGPTQLQSLPAAWKGHGIARQLGRPPQPSSCAQPTHGRRRTIISHELHCAVAVQPRAAHTFRWEGGNRQKHTKLAHPKPQVKAAPDILLADRLRCWPLTDEISLSVPPHGHGHQAWVAGTRQYGKCKSLFFFRRYNIKTSFALPLSTTRFPQ
jgi:hypothetical protein